MAIRTIGSLSDSVVKREGTRVSPRLLRELTRRLVAETKPEQIYLFGSNAYGKPHQYSALDLMIVTNEPSGASDNERHRFVNDKTSSALRDLSAMEFDVVARTPNELQERLDQGHPFDREIVLRGQVLYARLGAPRRYHPERWRNRMPDSTVVAEWIERAEEDYQNALQILRRRKNPGPSSVCCNCQQAAEKYLKAYLCKTIGKFQHTRKLEELNEQCVQVDSSFLLIEHSLQPLTQYALKGRYPQSGITMEDAQEAVVLLKQVRKFLDPKLGLK